jgi:hypothetical protein
MAASGVFNWKTIGSLGRYPRGCTLGKTGTTIKKGQYHPDIEIFLRWKTRYRCNQSEDSHIRQGVAVFFIRRNDHGIK